MNSFYRNRTSLFLMGGSLALLAVFIGLWLQKVYRDEYDRLREQTDFLLFDSVREMEDELFKKVLVDPVVLSGPDSVSERQVNMFVEKGIDSARLFVFKHQETITDSNIQVAIRSEVGPEEGGKPIKGTLSFIVAVAESRQGLDSVSLRLDSLEIKPLLSRQLEIALKASDLPSSAKLVCLDSSAAIPLKAMVSSTYEDAVKGERYAVEIPGYRSWLLRKMAPQVFFVLLLFASVSFAFFVVYKNLLKQQRLTELKNDFIRNVTHELKTPITTVGVAIEAISEFGAGKNPEKTREYLDISKHELNRLSILVDKVLKMSLFEKTEPELRLETVDLIALVKEVLNSMKLQFEKLDAGVRFTPEGESLSLEADAAHLTSVVYNLLDNALKYSAGRPQVEIGLSRQGNYLRLSVADRGIGIAAEHQDRIFDRFYRVPTGDTHNVKGYGLGLSYVASVVRQHRGKIEVESKPGHGAVFTITLPVKHEPD